MNRYCYEPRYKKGYWNRFKKVALQPQPGRRQKSKPRSAKKSRNKTTSISQDRFSVERLLKHSGLFGLAAITYRGNVRSSQIEFHIFASLLNTSNKRTNPINNQYGGKTWGKRQEAFNLGGLCCRCGLAGFAMGPQRILRHALQQSRQLRNERTLPGERRIEVPVRLGKGRLRKHPLHQGSGRIVRREVRKVRGLRRGIVLRQL